MVMIGWDVGMRISLLSIVVVSTPANFRAAQRRKKTAEKPLSQEQSGRTWKFAEVLTKAMAIFGTQKEAEQWLERPAIGLDQRRPIDLLATPAGAKIVEDFLDRLEYGVYA
jgi:putative toxin-antitoxin system antitoxin component (TIGR02293 family)